MKLKIKSTLKSQSDISLLQTSQFRQALFSMLFTGASLLISHSTFALSKTIDEKHQTLTKALTALSKGNAADRLKALQIIGSSQPKALLQGGDPIADLSKTYAISDASPPISRGHLSGPLMRTANFSGNTENYDLVFEGGKLALVTLHNEDALTLKVYQEGTEICHQEIDNHVAHCRWTPSFSAQYTISVFGSNENRSIYTLLID